MTARLTSDLRPVPDVVEASTEWGANCGPTAIAAALGLTLREVKPAVAPTNAFKGYMGVADFRAAIPRACGRIVQQWSKPFEPVDCFAFGHALSRSLANVDGPVIVLARFCGLWDHVPRAAATYRHAFAFRRCIVGDPTYWLQHLSDFGWVYDVNARAGWMPHRAWCNQVLVDLLPERGDGCVAVDWMAQVERAGAS